MDAKRKEGSRPEPSVGPGRKRRWRSSAAARSELERNPAMISFAPRSADSWADVREIREQVEARGSELPELRSPRGEAERP